jgi:anti-anti-sigma regulatory factor
MMLETEVFKFEPDIIGIACSGRFTLGNRLSELEGLVNSLVEEGARKIVIDLAQVEFVDSAGLGLIMRTFGEIGQLSGQLRFPAPTSKRSVCSTSLIPGRSWCSIQTW